MKIYKGTWKFFWKYDGVPDYFSYNTHPVTFHEDGTWSVGGLSAGKWCEQNGMVNFNFNGNTILEFVGVRQLGAMVGIFDWSGYPTSHGVWYMIRNHDLESQVVQSVNFEKEFPKP